MLVWYEILRLRGDFGVRFRISKSGETPQQFKFLKKKIDSNILMALWSFDDWFT